MESSQPTRHFKPPWTLIRENSERYVVRDANGVTVAWPFCRDDSQRYSFGASKLTSDEACRIGKAISRIPDFMSQRQGFYGRNMSGRSPRCPGSQVPEDVIEDTTVFHPRYALRLVRRHCLMTARSSSVNS